MMVHHDGPPAYLAIVGLLVLGEDGVAKGEGRQGAGTLGGFEAPLMYLYIS